MKYKTKKQIQKEKMDEIACREFVINNVRHKIFDNHIFYGMLQLEII